MNTMEYGISVIQWRIMLPLAFMIIINFLSFSISYTYNS